MHQGTTYVDFQCWWAQRRQIYDATKFQFVNVELDLAITYCLIAAVTTDRAGSYRNISNAERAYSTAAYFLDGNLDAAQKQEINEKLSRFYSLRVLCDSAIDTIHLPSRDCAAWHRAFQRVPNGVTAGE